MESDADPGCCDPRLAGIANDGLHADEDLIAWRDGFLHKATEELIDVLRRQGVEGATVLDIGAGVGAVHTALLESGAAHAIDVDASAEYLEAAADEAKRRGLFERVEYRHGDVVQLADGLPPADITILDSVICCYPYLAPLLRAAVRPGPRIVGITYPRDTWAMRTFMRLFNIGQFFRRQTDRYFVHRHAKVNTLMADAGYANVHEGGTSAWRVVLYRRLNGAAGNPAGSLSAAGPR
jgi:magnesium-protoporphyrin O-methyltransferase